MKTIRFFLNIILIFITLAANAQIYKIDGHVADSLTKQNLAFVNIVINDNGTLGTTTDIDGNFEIRSRSEINTLTFSYVGYKSKTIEITKSGSTNIQVLLRSEDIELQEVVVHAGENPAHRIIENVIKNRKRNDPENLDSYSYIIYDRMILTLDTTLITDSVMMNFSRLIHRNDLMVMETVSKKTHKRPNKNKREVQANIISGIGDPTYFYILDGMQSMSFYDDFITIAQTDYVNPATPGSTSRYFFNIESKMPVSEQDTIFQISFKPRKGKNFNGLRGVFTIHSDGWAIANVKAEPAESGNSASPLMFKTKIQQLYTKVNDSVWFPQQLNTDIEFFEFIVSEDKKEVYMSAVPGQKNTLKMIGVGKSYISNIAINEEIDNKTFNNTEIDLAANSGSRGDDFWKQYRNDSISKRISNTNAFVERMEKRFKIDADKMLDNAMSFAERNSIPVGFIDISLNDILSFNNADGWYLGLGIQTNKKMSRRLDFGGYFGYWFGSKSTNYGGNFDLRIDRRHNFDLNLAYDHKFINVGEYGFQDKNGFLLNESNYKSFYIKWTTLNTTASAELSCRFGKSLQGFVKFSVSDKNIYDWYSFSDGNNTYNGDFRISALDFRFRIAPRERLMGGPDGLVVIEKGKPTILIGYKKSLLNVFDCPFNFDKIQIQYSDYWKFRYFGTTSLTIQGGYLFGKTPLMETFNIFGTNSGFGLYTTESFMTMKPNEFFCDKFLAVYFNHNFGRFFKTSFFNPEFIFVTNIAFGDLQDKEVHSFDGYELKSLKDGYYESGLAIDNILDLKTAHIGFACLYRYGPYSFDKIGDNFVYKLKITFSF